MTVAVVTDGAAAIPRPLAAAHGVAVVPLHLVVGDDVFDDGDITLAELLDRWDEGVTTSAPSPGEFLTAVSGRGADEVVVLTVSRAMSGTWNAARLAAESADVPVTTIDTETAAGAQALVVLAAADAAAAGADRATVAATAREVIARVRLVAVVDGLDHLVRTGRVPGVAGWAGRQLGLQPLFELRQGRIRRLRPVAGRDAALDRIVGECVGDGPGAGPDGRLHVVAMHADAPDAAETLAKRVRQDVEPATELVVEFSPLMAAHTGPGLVGLAWWWQPAPA